MPTKRRKIQPSRINEPMPAWAARLLEGERPPRDTPDYDSFLGWWFFDDQVPGLPDPLSPEGAPLWRQADAD